jgi:hypothetical protein
MKGCGTLWGRLAYGLAALALVSALPGCAARGVAPAEEGGRDGSGPQWVGTWKLLSMTWRDEATGQEVELWGQGAVGFLTYTREGRMSAVITAAGRRSSTPSVAEAPVGEQAALFRNSFAYAGRYTPTSGGVVHHVEVATDPTWVGQDQERFTRMEGNRLIVRGAPIRTVDSAAPKALVLVWERAE